MSCSAALSCRDRQRRSWRRALPLSSLERPSGDFIGDSSSGPYPLSRSSAILYSESLYLYATLGVALGFMAFSGVRIIEFALRVRDFSGLDPAALVVWGLIWAYHWNVATSGGPESTLETRGIRRLYLYLASAMGVAMLATGVGGILYLLLQEGYSATFADLVLDPTPTGLGREALRSSAALALVGGAIWWSHWLRFAGADRGSVLRWIYLFIASIGGGAVIAAQVGFGLRCIRSGLLDSPRAGLRRESIRRPARRTGNCRGGRSDVAVLQASDGLRGRGRRPSPCQEGQRLPARGRRANGSRRRHGLRIRHLDPALHRRL